MFASILVSCRIRVHTTRLSASLPKASTHQFQGMSTSFYIALIATVPLDPSAIAPSSFVVRASRHCYRFSSFGPNLYFRSTLVVFPFFTLFRQSAFPLLCTYLPHFPSVTQVPCSLALTFPLVPVNLFACSLWGWPFSCLHLHGGGWGRRFVPLQLLPSTSPHTRPVSAKRSSPGECPCLAGDNMLIFLCDFVSPILSTPSLEEWTGHIARCHFCGLDFGGTPFHSCELGFGGDPISVFWAWFWGDPLSKRVALLIFLCDFVHFESGGVDGTRFTLLLLWAWFWGDAISLLWAWFWGGAHFSVLGLVLGRPSLKHALR
jgi:hypothetical protein